MVRIHVNQHIIRRNKTHNETNPPLTIIRRNKRFRGHQIQIKGDSKIVYSPDKPLACGARVWIEADDAVVI